MYDNNGSFAEGYAIGRDSSGNGYGNGMLGADWLWIILIFCIFGWGNNGFGGFGGGNQSGYDLGKVATAADVASGFNNSAVLGGLNDLKLGQAGIQQSMCQGFNGIQSSIMSLGFDLQNCCCQTQRAIDGVNYNMATNACAIQNTIQSSTRDIIDAQRAGTDAILGFLTNEKISSLQAENATLTAQLSQNAQTDRLLTAINRTPVPAYQVPNPYAGYANCGCC